MTYQDIQNDVVDRLHVGTSKDYARVGRAIQERYRQVCSAIGVESAVRTTVTANTTMNSRLVTFALEKIFSIWDANVTPIVVLEELTFDQIMNGPTVTSPPTRYAIQNALAATTTIIMNATMAATGAYTLTAEGQASQTDLAVTATPVFSSDFHDILIHGALSTILRTQGKYTDAAVEEDIYKTRLSDLRYFIAKSAYLDITQGLTGPTKPGGPLAAS